LALPACDPAGKPPKSPAATGESPSALPPVELSDQQFAAAVRRLMREDTPSPERSALLAGAIARQMSHAAVHFARGDADRGSAAVTGALYLLRIGEGRADMFGPDGDRALAGAIRKFSARGDEGRSLALMLMRASLLPAGSAERRELDQHLDALQRWMKDTHTGGEMTTRAADMHAAVARALVEPTEDALDRAVQALARWIDRAVKYNQSFRRTGQPPPRKEAMEAFAALQAGGAAMAALLLRYGRAAEALQHIEGSSADTVVPGGLRRALAAAADDDTAADWRQLALAYAHRSGELGASLDPQLRMAAVWGAAIESYRRDPTDMAVAHLLSELLVAYGMPEVAPLVLSDALGPQPSASSLSSACAVVMEALAAELDTGTTATARRIFAASGLILQLADRSEYRGRVDPSAAALRQLMAGIEIRSGHADAARPLMLAALKAEPSVWGWTMLAMLERQVGNDQQALGHAARAANLPEVAVQLPGSAHQLDAAEAQLIVFAIQRDRGERPQAERALEAALEIALATRKGRLSPGGQVRAERVLAKVLDGYGEHRGAAKAMARALELAASHRPLLGSTMLAAIHRALVHKELDAARLALRAGLEAEVEQDDLVYGALWVMLLEQQLDETPDGSVERVLGPAVNSPSWTGQLARWAQRQLDDAALRRAAASHLQRIEAEFYIAMRALGKGDASASEPLRRIGYNPLIDLMEVHIARELLAPHMELKVPSKYVLP